jgi:hypothetical protein
MRVGDPYSKCCRTSPWIKPQIFLPRGTGLKWLPEYYGPAVVEVLKVSIERKA